MDAQRSLPKELMQSKLNHSPLSFTTCADVVRTCKCMRSIITAKRPSTPPWRTATPSLSLPSHLGQSGPDKSFLVLASDNIQWQACANRYDPYCLPIWDLNPFNVTIEYALNAVNQGVTSLGIKGWNSRRSFLSSTLTM